MQAKNNSIKNLNPQYNCVSASCKVATPDSASTIVNTNNQNHNHSNSHQHQHQHHANAFLNSFKLKSQNANSYSLSSNNNKSNSGHYLLLDRNLPFQRIGSSEELKCRSSSDAVHSQADEDRRRRTIIVERDQRNNDHFGFTLQTYGIRHRKEGEVELITYVDMVDLDGPAFKGGMRPGDVILAINGKDVEKADHRKLVDLIKSCPSTMRMVVLFEDCVRKVELHIKYLKLRRSLHQKVYEYDMLCQRERQILMGEKKKRNISVNKSQDISNMKQNITKDCSVKTINGAFHGLDKLDIVNCNDIHININSALNHDQAKGNVPKMSQLLSSQEYKSSTSDLIPATLPRRKSTISFNENSVKSITSSAEKCLDQVISIDDRDVVTKL